MSAIVRPFAFAAEFQDNDAGPVTLASLELEVELLRRQLAEAHERGLAEGREQALTILRAERDTALLGATEALTASLITLDARFDDTEREVARLGAELAFDLADHLAGQALERDPATPIDAMIGRALQQVRRNCPLRIHVAPALVSAIEDLCRQRQDRDRRRLNLTVIADEALSPGDARLDWEGGAMLLEQDARKSAMAAEIAATLAA